MDTYLVRHPSSFNMEMVAALSHLNVISKAEESDARIKRRKLRADFREVETAYSSASAELSAIFGSPPRIGVRHRRKGTVVATEINAQLTVEQ